MSSSSSLCGCSLWWLSQQVILLRLTRSLWSMCLIWHRFKGEKVDVLPDSYPHLSRHQESTLKSKLVPFSTLMLRQIIGGGVINSKNTVDVQPLERRHFITTGLQSLWFLTKNILNTDLWSCAWQQHNKITHSLHCERLWASMCALHGKCREVVCFQSSFLRHSFGPLVKHTHTDPAQEQQMSVFLFMTLVQKSLYSLTCFNSCVRGNCSISTSTYLHIHLSSQQMRSFSREM